MMAYQLASFSNALGMKQVAAKVIPKLLNFVVACS
jgi:hypothetical protein